MSPQLSQFGTRVSNSYCPTSLKLLCSPPSLGVVVFGAGVTLNERGHSETGPPRTAMGRGASVSLVWCW
jgi:hypothetical protein